MLRLARPGTSRRAAKTESAHSLRSQLLNQLELLPPSREPERYQGGALSFFAARPTNHRDGGAGFDVTASPMTTPLDLYPHGPSTPPSWWCPIPVVNPDSQIIAASFTSIDFLHPHT